MGFVISDLFQQLFEGNGVAWLGLIEMVLIVALATVMVLVWWKLPQVAKAALKNGTLNNGGPFVANCYENNHVRFETPKMFGGGFAYFKKVLYVFPKVWGNSIEALKPEQRELINSACHIDGMQGQFYMQYSIQTKVMNPALLTALEFPESLEYLKDKEAEVDKKKLIKALESIPDVKINLKAINLSFPLNVKDMRTLINKSISKSDAAEFENAVRQDARGDQQGANYQLIIIVLLIASVAIGGIGLAKQFGVF